MNHRISKTILAGAQALGIGDALVGASASDSGKPEVIAGLAKTVHANCAKKRVVLGNDKACINR